MFSCKCCVAHKAHIESLKAQVADLRSLTIPTSPRNQLMVEYSDMEADATLEARSDQITVNLQDQKEQLLIDAEAARVLSGNY